MEPTQKVLERKFRPLTPMEARMLELHDKGLTRRDIAAAVGWRSSRSVEHVLEYALNKVGRYE